MYKDKSVLAIIPARSGSKGLIDKNIKLLNGKPLIAYTIEAAIESEVCTDIIVSTDSLEYAEIAKKYRAEVPFLRPKELSADNSATEDVIIFTLNKLKDMNKIYDYFLVLQPTSPLRLSSDIRDSIRMLIDEDLNSIVSVCEEEHSPLLCNKLDESLSLNGFIKKENNKRRQDLNKYYRINGAIYATKTNHYIETRDFYGDLSKAYIMNNLHSIDIDTNFDFRIAEYILKNNYLI
ncbi:cytidylyltransferase domain-containing protein [Clostridium sp. MB05]